MKATSKGRWFLTILILAFLGYLLISKLNPSWGWSIDNVVGGALGSAKAGIEASPIWQAYDVWFALTFGVIATLLITWKARTAYHKLVGPKIVGQKKDVGYQVTPSAQPLTIPTAASQPQVVTVTPTASLTPPTVTVMPEKKEETKT